MLPITLKCSCGATLEIMPKGLKDLGEICKANEWRMIGGGRIGRDRDTAALCPTCAAHEKRVKEIGDEIASR